MFGDTLLESASTARKGKRWPMATAFTAEAIIAGLLIIIPLLSTGVIPILARAPIPIAAPVMVRPVERVPVDRTASGPTSAPRSATVVLANNNPNAIRYGHSIATTSDPKEVTPGYEAGSGRMPANLTGSGSDNTNIKLDGPKRIVSQLTEAQLVNRVEPVYPHIATISGIQGQVKLHAIIARDGSVQSLNAISGHPLLVRAALDAVQQWRYRPYVLNGEAVEVETFITVNFRREVR
jgi:protein TonB